MSQICLMDFQEEDKFSQYEWEGDYIKEFSFESEEPNKFGIEIFESKRVLSTKRVPKKKGLDFCVLIDVFNKSEHFSFCDCQTFKTEKEAIDFFVGEKETQEFFKKMNDKGRFFDGRRYFWNLNEKGKATDGGWF